MLRLKTFTLVGNISESLRFLRNQMTALAIKIYACICIVFEKYLEARKVLIWKQEQRKGSIYSRMKSSVHSISLFAVRKIY